MLARGLALVLGACGGGAPQEPPSDCPSDLPAACPTVPPSYTRDVAPVFSRVCIGCHSPPGRVPERPLTDWASVFRQRGDVLHQVYSCRMPAPDAPEALLPDERQVLLTWLVCGAPNN